MDMTIHSLVEFPPAQLLLEPENLSFTGDSLLGGSLSAFRRSRCSAFAAAMMIFFLPSGMVEERPASIARAISNVSSYSESSHVSSAHTC